MSKVVLVTGTSSGLGIATAVGLAKGSYKVYASMRQPSRGQQLEAALQKAGAKATILALDVEDEASIDAAFASVMQKEKRLDVLVNVAGYAQLRAFEQQSMSDIQRQFNINCFGVMRCIKRALPIMRAQKSGHIVTVTSIGGLVGQPLSEVYCASKFAVEGFIEGLATYLEPVFGIKNTLIEPAGIKTPFVTNAFADLELDLPLKDVYGKVGTMFRDATSARGSFEANAQTAEEVAAVILAEIARPSGALRIPTSAVAKAFGHEKLEGDSDGTKLLKKVRKFLLGIAE